MMTLKQRADRTDSVLARFRNKPFAWNTRGNCIHLAKAQARALGVAVPPVPGFSSYAGAVRALWATGNETLEDLLDWHLRRIPPAMMIVGDIAMLPGLAPFNALVIAAGGQMVVGWHESDMSRMHSIAVSRSEIVAAWAVGR